MDALKQIADTIKREQLLRPEAAVVAAVSGGADSLCLAWTLRELGYQLKVAHIDHGLRPKSRQEADFVRELAERWGVPLFETRVEPPSEPPGSQEAWARAVRYRFLLRVATEQGVTSVATGHTADDQVETILMNLIRGAGPNGLAGMPYAGPIPLPESEVVNQPVVLLRPLLDLWREQTEDCCRRAGLNPRQDTSNLDLAYTRNRIRHQVLPQLAELNPAVKGALLRTGWLMRSLSSWIEQEIDRAWPALTEPAQPAGYWLERESIRSMPEVLAMGLLRRAHQRLGEPGVELDFQHSQQALEMLSHGDRGQSLSLPGGLKLEIIGARALLSPVPAQVLSSQVPQLGAPVELVMDGETQLKAGWRIKAERRPAEKGLLHRVTAGQPPFDNPRLEAISLGDPSKPLQLRTPRPGEEIKPLGLAGSMKLADFFINEGVPQPLRRQWPLLVRGEEVLWVVGWRITEPAKVVENEDTILLLELLPPE